MMKTAVAVLMLVTGATLQVALGADPTYPEFRSEAGGFSVTAPVALEQRTVSRDLMVGKLVTHVFEGRQGKTAYAVLYTDLFHSVQPSDLQKVLDGFRDGAVSGMNGKLLVENLISLDGNPGRELVVNAKAKNGEDQAVKARIFLVKARMYEVMVIAAKGEVRDSETDDFLQSFRLLAE